MKTAQPIRWGHAWQGWAKIVLLTACLFLPGRAVGSIYSRGWYVLSLSETYAIRGGGGGPSAILVVKAKGVDMGGLDLAEVHAYATSGPWIYGQGASLFDNPDDHGKTSETEKADPNGWSLPDANGLAPWSPRVLGRGSRVETVNLTWFLFDMRIKQQDAMNSLRFFKDKSEWEVALRKEGIVAAELARPDDVAKTRPAIEVRPWDYRIMRGLLGLSDDDWGVVFLPALAVACVLLGIWGVGHDGGSATTPGQAWATIIIAVLSIGLGVYYQSTGDYPCCAGFTGPGLCLLLGLWAMRIRRRSRKATSQTME